MRGGLIVVALVCGSVSSFSITTTTTTTRRHGGIGLASLAAAAEPQQEKSITQRIMEKTEKETQASGAGGASTYEAFQKAETNWSRLKSFQPFRYDPKLGVAGNPIPPPPPFVTDDGAVGNPEAFKRLREEPTLDFDVVVCGGTLGVFFAVALLLQQQQQQHKVCLIEAGKLRGRQQEWNISMKELEELVSLGVLDRDDVDAAIQTEFPGCRSGFKNREVTPLAGGYAENGIGYECITPNVLNLGVAPSVLLERVKQRFLDLGGTLLEDTTLQNVIISDRMGAALTTNNNNNNVITTRLVLDAMGNASPITRQQRYGDKPDGICAVVGSCAAGFDEETNRMGDIIYTNTEIQDKGQQGKLQYFFEMFPVGIGRNGTSSSNVKTTYMFTYMDADENRPSLETLMDDYWKLLPLYQPSIEDPERDLCVKRVLFAFFPTYRDSPLAPAWNRLLAVGDSSGIQSPLSFGGFGALTRHLERITGAISEALAHDCLSKDDLGQINAYTPNLSAAWMFQKAMSVRMNQKGVDPKFVNRLLATNFQVMNDMGDQTIRPFLQDVVRFDGLVGSLARSFVADPTFMPQIIAHVGPVTLVEWLGHVGMMGLYAVLHGVATPVLGPFVDKLSDPRQRFRWRRKMEAWKFGSGSDYILE